MLLILRVFLGALFIIHGWPKIKDLKQNASNFQVMGFRPGSFWGTIVALVEFFGGIALILGLFVQLFGLFLAIEMAVAAIWRIKSKHKFIGGYEFDLALLLASLVLATSGGGRYALDYFLQFFIY